ncbi:hypothetical protein WDW37_12625 [Bdellovibrionota bacterium FG-1]
MGPYSRFFRKTFPLILAGLSWGDVCVEQAFAEGSQSSLQTGIALFQQDANATVGERGYFLLFQVEPKTGWIRPTYGGSLELNLGVARTILGQVHGGVELVAASAKYAKPFLGIEGLYGWANLGFADGSYLGNLYGTAITAGVEIRGDSKDKGSALRISSSWRYLMGSVGAGVTGNDYNAMLLSIGVTF